MGLGTQEGLTVFKGFVSDLGVGRELVRLVAVMVDMGESMEEGRSDY